MLTGTFPPAPQRMINLKSTYLVRNVSGLSFIEFPPLNPTTFTAVNSPKFDAFNI
ncbi:MAG: hypothetical protein ACM3PX_09510 [Omnitrophica WOR_2 bacterium]